MQDVRLPSIYRRYLAALNDRRWHDLGEFVDDDLVYNGRAMRRAEYADMIAKDVAAVPDLLFNAEVIVADDTSIACRLTFDCLPVGEFLGLEPTGRRVSFAEHAFYRFAGDRIAEVWSLIDREAVERQLKGGA